MNMLLLLPLILSSTDEAEIHIKQLAWLGGCWRTAGGNYEENWSDLAGGTMLATQRSVKGERTVHWEFLRIQPSKYGYEYVAQPKGQKAVSFPLTEITADKVVFQNPKHDFPQTIVYERTQEKELKIFIEGEIKGKKRSQTIMLERIR